MDATCKMCNKKTPHKQIVKIQSISLGSNHPKKEAAVICGECEQDLKDYEKAWHVLSH